jgi:hypothetical protein
MEEKEKAASERRETRNHAAPALRNRTAAQLGHTVRGAFCLFLWFPLPPSLSLSSWLLHWPQEIPFCLLLANPIPIPCSSNEIYQLSRPSLLPMGFSEYCLLYPEGTRGTVEV